MNNGKQQAFPSTRKYIDGNTEVINIQFGLTKREYFAGLAMQGIIQNQSFLNNLYQDVSLGVSLEKLVSIASIELADEILKQLEK